MSLIVRMTLVLTIFTLILLKMPIISDCMSQNGRIQANSINSGFDEMKERICLGFSFEAKGPNCTFQISKDSAAIASAFPECKQIMINQCKRKKNENFCEKGKAFSLKSNAATLNEKSSHLPTSPVDCALLSSETITLSGLNSIGLDAYGKCCTICEKAKLYAMEIGHCKHRQFSDYLIENTFNECCYSKYYYLQYETSFLARKTSSNLDSTTLSAQLLSNGFEELSSSFNAETSRKNSKLSQMFLSIVQERLKIDKNKMVIAIQQLYVEKAKLLLDLKRNATLEKRLNPSENSLIRKALDTSKLDEDFLGDLIGKNGHPSLPGNALAIGLNNLFSSVNATDFNANSIKTLADNDNKWNLANIHLNNLPSFINEEDNLSPYF